jgi:hypothetical protein
MNILKTNNMKEEHIKIKKDIIRYFPDLEQDYIEYIETINHSPIGFLEGVTLKLIEQNIFKIELWVKFLNRISEFNDREVDSGIRYSLEVLYLESEYEKYLLENLNDKLKKEYLVWVEYYK